MTWIVWVAIGISTGCATMVIAHALGSRKIASWIFAVGATVASFGAIYLFKEYAEPAHVAVVITSPENDFQLRGPRLTVRGTATPPDARVTLVVRSETDLRWWVQSIVIPEHSEGSSGQWSINAFVGTEDQGKNENFQVIALASSDSHLFNLLTGRALRAGITLGHIPLWSQSEPVVVRRVR